jgi:hypothetical protein
MFVTVRVFNDDSREFDIRDVNTQRVEGIDVDAITMYGPHGVSTCRKVYMMSGCWFFVAYDDAAKLKG